MNEENKVELDTDDVQEENVSVQEQPKEEKPEQVEVDLGYKDPVKQETKAKIVTTEETPEPQTEDNLPEHTQNVQKRIDQLTRKMREAERREKAALDYAKGLQKKYSDAEAEAKKFDQNFISEFDSRVDAQREQVKATLKTAIENNDADQIMELNDKLTQLAVEKEKARLKKQQFEDEKAKQEATSQQPQAQQVQQPQPDPSPKAKEWAEKNTWFGNDSVMTNAAFGVHQELVDKGFDGESDEYYNEVDKRMREYFPQKFSEDTKPVQTVASAGRKQKGRKVVKLTRSQVAIAKKLGVPLEEYAKFV
tara:strand:- start:1382 stop:2302 length:921 start_codon:yes stop_codon:yes gene_type:complete